MTVIVDRRTHKVIWFSKSRSRVALDLFFETIGPEACKDIETVAIDQYEAYSASAAKHYPKAKVVWDCSIPLGFKSLTKPLTKKEKMSLKISILKEQWGI